MVGVIINPGTEADGSAILQNAIAIVERICHELSISSTSVTRLPTGDKPEAGYFAFTIRRSDAKIFTIDVPGDDPERFFASRPFYSRRMYVDGSSWLWGYAASAIERRLSGEQEILG